MLNFCTLIIVGTVWFWAGKQYAENKAADKELKKAKENFIHCSQQSTEE